MFKLENKHTDCLIILQSAVYLHDLLLQQVYLGRSTKGCNLSYELTVQRLHKLLRSHNLEKQLLIFLYTYHCFSTCVRNNSSNSEVNLSEIPGDVTYRSIIVLSPPFTILTVQSYKTNQANHFAPYPDTYI